MINPVYMGQWGHLFVVELCVACTLIGYSLAQGSGSGAYPRFQRGGGVQIYAKYGRVP